MRAQFVFSEVWIGLRRNLTMTVALIVVVAISLSLLGTGLMFVKQVDNTRAYWQSRVQLSVYLCSAGTLGGTCEKNGPGHRGGDRDHPAGAEQQQGHRQRDLRLPVGGLQAVQAGVRDQRADRQVHRRQPDPELLRGTAARTPRRTPSPVSQVVDGYPGVAEVVDDSSILSGFYKLLDGARNAVVIIAIFLLVAAILLVANTIRLSAFNRRRETSIMRLVGASNFYVQLPFLVEGMIAGLFGWLVATGLLILVKSVLLGSLQHIFPYGVSLTHGRPGGGDHRRDDHRACSSAALPRS